MNILIKLLSCVVFFLVLGGQKSSSGNSYFTFTQARAIYWFAGSCSWTLAVWTTRYGILCSCNFLNKQKFSKKFLAMALVYKQN